MAADRYELYKLVFPNGKFYIGMARDSSKRWREHRASINVISNHNPVAHALRKYGANSVIVHILAVGPQSFISDLEISAIERFNTRDRRRGYNVALGGATSPTQAAEVAQKVSRTHRAKGIKPPTNAGTAALKKRWRDAEGNGTLSQLLTQLAGARLISGAIKPGTKWITNGVDNRRLLSGQDIPSGWAFGQTMVDTVREARKLAGRKHLGKTSPFRWVTNGKDDRTIKLTESVPDGWYYGRTNNGHRGLKRTLLTRQKQSDRAMGRTVKAATRAKHSLRTRGNRWITDGVRDKFLKVDFPPPGWRFGRGRYSAPPS